MRDEDLPRGVASFDAETVYVHFDGACQPPKGGGVAGYGFTVEGSRLQHEEHGLAVPPLHPNATNNVAEYVAAIRALEWLAAQGYRGAVVASGDSQLVIRQMTGEYEVRAEHLRPYHDRLRTLVGEFDRVQFLWIPREQNLIADRLSKLAIEEAGSGALRRSQ